MGPEATKRSRRNACHKPCPSPAESAPIRHPGSSEAAGPPGRAGAGAIGEKAVAIAEAKASLSFSEAFFRGVLCNALVCLSMWLAMAARDVTGKILAIIFPISAFVAVGFEHSVANMFFFPLAMLASPDAAAAGITAGAFVENLIPVTLDNIVGGSVFVALIYYVIYLRGSGPGTEA
ncbi:MAG: formate/nitrite transporter family protein [Proteobacteria bacterium]|nr:formate/nitrite transporter family protein [Pseudomonadota bacterium]